MGNKQKNKPKKKIKFAKIFFILFIVIVIISGIYFFLTVQDEESKLTLLERQWIEKNKSSLIDINVPSNINVISSEGTGMLLSFLNSVEETTELKFNMISYNYPDKIDENKLGFAVLRNEDLLKSTDILINEDPYVLIGLNEGYIEKTEDITNTKIGILEIDKSLVSKYISNNIEVKSYSTFDELFKSLSSKQVDYIIAPLYITVDKTITNDFHIKYFFNNITNKIVLRFGDNARLNSIMTKLIEDWKDRNLRKDFEKSLYDFFVDATKTTDLELYNLTNKVYKYGFVKGSSYNVKKSGKLYGYAGEYINALSNMTNIEFEFIEYNNNDELISAIKGSKVDIAFVNFDHVFDLTKQTDSPFVKKMVALSNTYYPITAKPGLIDRKVYLLKGNYLDLYINNNFNSIIKNIDDISNNIKNDIILLDETDYWYFKESNLPDYKLLFSDYYEGNPHFEIQNDQDILYKLLNFTLNSVDTNEYRTISTNNLVLTLDKEQSFKSIYMIVLAIVLVPIFIIIIMILTNKNFRKLKIVKKEEVLKYNDLLTSLKNRNYLNDNIKFWNETKVYPRTIIIIDLNNLKYVNDNYGHEEGNNLIKKAAAVLINTQLEKSEIIRSDGNEFLIYLIGYSKTQIENYTSKLAKEFDKLPHGFSAAIGFSMIADEIKTVDDAINEATIEMRIDKEKNYK